jgi:hypothetical protein
LIELRSTWDISKTHLWVYLDSVTLIKGEDLINVSTTYIIIGWEFRRNKREKGESLLVQAFCLCFLAPMI